MDDRFTDLVRDHANLEPGAPIDVDTTFADLGVSSLGIVQLLVEVEEAYDVEFSDDLLVPETFVSPRRFWDALSRVRS